MPRKRKSLKPDRPLSSIIFSDTGKVRLAVEHLPRAQGDLELSIGTKFAAAMQHLRGEQITEMGSGSGRGDLICRNSSGTEIKIQVVEVVDPVMSTLNERRSSYRVRIINELPTAMKQFDGCRLTLIDQGTEPFLPRLQSRAGEAYFTELTEKIQELGADIDTLSVGKRRIRKWRIGPNQVLLIADCERRASPDSGFPCQLSLTGGRSFKAGEDRMFLTQAVQTKIRKHYSKPKELFWLLVYSSDVLLRDDDPDLVAATELLNNADHPFDMVLYFFPYSKEDLGHLVRVWP